MKRIYLITLALIFFSTYLSAQTCLPQGINFYTQAQLDNFALNYPDCTEIRGDVRMGLVKSHLLGENLILAETLS